MRKPVLILVAVGVLYGLVWWLLAHFYGYSLSSEATLLHSDLRQTPFLKFCLDLFGIFPAPLLAYTLFCNVLTLIALGVLVQLLDERLSAAIAAVSLFAASTWPTFYFFSATEAPLSGLLAVSGAGCIVQAFRAPTRISLWLCLAGLLGGLQAGTSIAALAFLFLMSLAVYLLSAAWKHSRRWQWLGVYLGSAVLTLMASLKASGGSFAEAVGGKMESSAFLEELSQLGVVQKVPFGSFFFIGGYYAPTLIFAGLLGCILFSFIFLDLKHRRSMAERILFLLCLVVLIHPVLIDLLPVSRTASLHYPIYPFLIAVVVLVARYWLDAMERGRSRFISISALFVTLTVAINVWHTRELILVKQESARMARELSRDAEAYVLADDIHAGVIASWLQKPIRRIDSPESLLSAGAKRVLIIGPHGTGSSKTAQTVASTKDYLRVLRKPADVLSFSTPYYGLYPAFLFENEIASAYYLSGTAPDRELKNLHVTFWVYPSTDRHE